MLHRRHSGVSYVSSSWRVYGSELKLTQLNAPLMWMFMRMLLARHPSAEPASERCCTGFASAFPSLIMCAERPGPCPNGCPWMGRLCQTAKAARRRAAEPPESPPPPNAPSSNPARYSVLCHAASLLTLGRAWAPKSVAPSMISRSCPAWLPCANGGGVKQHCHQWLLSVLVLIFCVCTGGSCWEGARRKGARPVGCSLLPVRLDWGSPVLRGMPVGHESWVLCTCM